MKISPYGLTAALLLAAQPLLAQSRPGLRFAITVPTSRSSAPIDGRLLLLISADTSGEPRFQVADSPRSAQVFGVDVE
ncbi:MAG TPA: hypothetical protein VHM30_00485, partial [Gemmatimonadaceae bacterium]|nr:hypothetical protein [Gemmatimonadaceae bacterium]